MWNGHRYCVAFKNYEMHIFHRNKIRLSESYSTLNGIFDRILMLPYDHCITAYYQSIIVRDLRINNSFCKIPRMFIKTNAYYLVFCGRKVKFENYLCRSN